MEEGVVKQVVDDPAVARVLTDPRQRRLLEPFMRGETTLSEAAEQLGVKLTTLNYHLRKFLDLGLVEVVRELPRRGRAIKLYRARAREFLVPFELTDSAGLDEHVSKLLGDGTRLIARNTARVMLEQSPSWAFHIHYDPEHGLHCEMRPTASAPTDPADASSPAGWISDQQLDLDLRAAKALERELSSLFMRYSRMRSGSGRSYRLFLGFAPVSSLDK